MIALAAAALLNLPIREPRVERASALAWGFFFVALRAIFPAGDKVYNGVNH